MFSQPLRRVAIIGNIYLFLYFIFALVYYKERIFLDGSYYFFHVVQHETFHIEHQRFILAISQLLTVIGTKLNLSLNTVLILNSVNPVIYLWSLFLLSTLWLRSEGICWALLLSSVCGIYFIYFIPMYEVWYGGVLLIFFAGILEKQFYQSRLQQIIFVLLLITLLFSYPLIFIGVIYFSAAHFLRVKKISKTVLSIYALVFLGWIFFKYFFISDYESGKIEYPLSQEGSIVSQNFGSFSGLWEWKSFLFHIYTEEMICFTATVIFLFVKRHRWQALLLIATLFAFLLLIGFFHFQPWKHSNYFERMYLLLIPLCFVPFFLNVFSEWKWKIVLEIFAVIVIGIRMSQIVQHSAEYEKHLDEISSLIEKSHQQQGSKFKVDFSKHPELNSLDEWSLPMEALIFSSLKSNTNSVTISWQADIENPSILQKLNAQNFRLRLDEIYPDSWLNKKYFMLQHGNYNELVLP